MANSFYGNNSNLSITFDKIYSSKDEMDRDKGSIYLNRYVFITGEDKKYPYTVWKKSLIKNEQGISTEAFIQVGGFDFSLFDGYKTELNYNADGFNKDQVVTSMEENSIVIRKNEENNELLFTFNIPAIGNAVANMWNKIYPIIQNTNTRDTSLEYKIGDSLNIDNLDTLAENIKYMQQILGYKNLVISNGIITINDEDYEISSLDSFKNNFNDINIKDYDYLIYKTSDGKYYKVFNSGSSVNSEELTDFIKIDDLNLYYTMLNILELYEKVKDSHGITIGKSLEGVEITVPGSLPLPAGEYSEIFNDYRPRTENLDGSVATGNIAFGAYSHAEGEKTSAYGQTSHAEGDETTASGYASHAEGYVNEASGEYSHTEGEKTKAKGIASHAEGFNAIASGDYSHAEGYQSQSSGYASHAEGGSLVTSGTFSHSEGCSTIVSQGTLIAYYPLPFDTLETMRQDTVNDLDMDINANHVEGFASMTEGFATHAEGFGTAAGGQASHAEGIGAKATGHASHAEGLYSEASGIASHAGGIGTIAEGEAQTVIGKYNKSNSTDLFIIGNGTDRNNRYNALCVDEHGYIKWEGRRGAFIVDGKVGFVPFSPGSENIGLFVHVDDEADETLKIYRDFTNTGYICYYILPGNDKEQTSCLYNIGSSRYPWSSITIKNSVSSASYTDGEGLSSDKRLKEVQPQEILNKSLLIYDNLIPVSYKYKNIEKADDFSRTHIGFLAQDVEEEIEKQGLTSEDCALVQIRELDESTLGCPDGKKYYLNYNELHGLHTLKNQQQDARISELEDKVSNLENELAEIKALLLKNNIS